jgi:hypothetical protein
MVVLPLPREMEGTYAILMRLRAHHFTKLSHSLCGGALYILELNVRGLPTVCQGMIQGTVNILFKANQVIIYNWVK